MRCFRVVFSDKIEDISMFLSSLFNDNPDQLPFSQADLSLEVVRSRELGLKYWLSNSLVRTDGPKLYKLG